MKEQLLGKLDNEQRRACSAPFGNILVTAVAGSGKTTVLTHRVAYTIDSGVNPEEILLLTFTNKASRQMFARIRTMLNVNKIMVQGGTFHSMGAKILRTNAHHLGYKPNFNVLDSDEACNLLDKSLKKYLKTSDTSKKDFPNKKVIYGLHSSSINLNLPLEEVAKKFSKSEVKVMKEIIAEYVNNKKQANIMDFDDLIMNFMKLLQIENVRAKLSNQFKYVLCDEYQDVNWIQGNILKLLNQGNNHLFVVGDANQSIYKWRGSDIRYIEDFVNTYPDAMEFSITYNYRSFPSILNLAETSINFNDVKKPVVITPFLKGGSKPVYESFREFEQEKYIVSKIKEYHSVGIPYNQISILLRTNFLTNAFERELRFNRIPYQMIAGFSFFDRAHVKDVISFLKIINNPHDETAYTRIFKMLDNVGETTSDNAIEHLKNHLFAINTLPSMKASKKAKESLVQFVEIVEKMKLETTISGCIDCLCEYYYEDYLRLHFEDANDREDDLKFMKDLSGRYEDLNEFLSDMLLTVEDDSMENNDGVILTTYHKAKGLEWDVVFMPFIGTLPYSLDEIQEERRLFYMGVTRAKKQLFITHTDRLPFSDKTIPESIFITELLDEDCFDSDDDMDIEF